jgi:hypothetical protein
MPTCLCIPRQSYSIVLRYFDKYLHRGMCSKDIKEIEGLNIIVGDYEKIHVE